MRDCFDWATIADDIVIPEQAAIAVYTNPNGAIVLRQAGQYGPDEDTWIVLDRSHALTLAKAVLDRAGLDMEIVPLTSLLVRNRDGVLMRPFPDQDVIDRLKEVEKAGRAVADIGTDRDDEDPAERKRKAAAERQRRRREKLKERDGHGGERDTDAAERDADSDTVTTAPALPELELHGGENTARTH